MYFKYLLCCCSKQDQAEGLPQPDPNASVTGGVKTVDHSHLHLLDQGVSGVQASIDDCSVGTGNINMQERSTDSATPKLEIKVLDGTSLPPGKVFKITSNGLDGTLRNANDGEVYFGSALKIKDLIVNDFQLPADEGVGNRHFMVKFNNTERKFFLKDLGEGTGTFVKVDTKLALKEGYILSFGDSHMLVQQFDLPGKTDTRVTLKFLDGPKIDQTFNFQPQESPIRIGRQADCQLRFDDSSLSRYQCQLTFDSGKGWHLQDGDGKKSSTNGTWLFVDSLFEVYDHMIFKAGQTLFEVSLM